MSERFKQWLWARMPPRVNQWEKAAYPHYRCRECGLLHRVATPFGLGILHDDDYHREERR